MANESTAVKAEWAVIAYLKPKCPGLTFYAGHGEEDMTKLPRCVVTFAEGTELCAGVDELPGQIQLLGLAQKKKPTDPSPVVVLTGYANTIRSELSDTWVDEVLQSTGLERFLEAVNKPESGPDNRVVKGFGMSGLSYEGQAEGRDEEHNHHGVLLRYRGVAHLEES